MPRPQPDTAGTFRGYCLGTGDWGREALAVQVGGGHEGLAQDEVKHCLHLQQANTGPSDPSSSSGPRGQAALVRVYTALARAWPRLTGLRPALKAGKKTEHQGNRRLCPGQCRPKLLFQCQSHVYACSYTYTCAHTHADPSSQHDCLSHCVSWTGTCETRWDMLDASRG